MHANDCCRAEIRKCDPTSHGGKAGDESEQQIECLNSETLIGADNSETGLSLSSSPEAAGGGAVKCRTVGEQISIKVNTDVSLETVGEPLEHHVHVDPVRVSPGVLKIQERSAIRADIKRMHWSSSTGNFELYSHVHLRIHQLIQPCQS